MTLISLQKCAQHDNKILKEKILTGLRQINFDLTELKNKRVCLKPNLLMPVSPERAVTTHPEIFRAVAQIVRDYTTNIVLIESPNIFALKPTIKKAGLAEIVKELGIEVADINITETLRFPLAHRYKNIDISKALFDVDFIINMPKLKTHGFTHYTGAVKNLFGVIPGLSKARMHMRAPSQMEFTEFLLDLYGGLLNGFEKPKNLFMSWMLRRNGVKVPENIQVEGESLEDMRIIDFKASRNSVMGGVIWPLISPTVKNLFVEKIEGCKWHPTEKYWSVPYSEGIIEKIKEVFDGEDIKSDPSLFGGAVETPPSSLYDFEDLRKELISRKYSRKTIKGYLYFNRDFLSFTGKRPDEVREENIKNSLIFSKSRTKNIF